MSLPATQALDYGTASPRFQEWAASSQDREWTKTEVRFHQFTSLRHRDGPLLQRHVKVFLCLGRGWAVVLNPHGPDGDTSDVLIALLLPSGEAVVDFCFCVKGPDGSELHHKKIFKSFAFGEEEGPNRGRGWVLQDRAFTRSVLTKYLVKGTLILEIRMRPSRPVPQIARSPSPFVPENPSSCKIIQNMFMDEKSADIVFEVGGQRKSDNGAKRAKTETTTFYAHRLILKQCATQLAELCEPEGEGGGMEPIQISDVTPEMFRRLLSYIYGRTIDGDELKSNAKEILDAADRYGISHLKLEAEACLVNKTTLTTDNVMEHLLYADGKNCALLKEAAMDFIVENNAEVLDKVSFEDVPGGPTMFRDILTAVARGEKKNGGTNRQRSEREELSTMRISDLRRRAHEKGLEVDGSRETLIASLTESS